MLHYLHDINIILLSAVMVNALFYTVIPMATQLPHVRVLKTEISPTDYTINTCCTFVPTY